MFRGFGYDDEAPGDDRAAGTQQQFYDGSAEAYWNQYPNQGSGDSAYSPPPLVATDQAEGSATSPKEWFGMGKDVVNTFLNIFGQPVGQKPPVQAPPPQPTMPVWGWAIIGIGAVAVLGFVIRSAKSPSAATAGYKRRRNRR